MADQQEHDQVDGGVADPGQGQMASPQQDTPPSVDVNDVAAKLLENPKFVELLDKRVQSTKDRRFAAQEKQITGFQEKLERLDNLMKEQGLSREQALDKMELEDRLDSLETKFGNDGSEPLPQPSGQAPNVDVDAAFKAVGIDPNSSVVTEFYKSGDVTPEAVLKFITTTKAQPTQAPSPAQAMPTPTGATPPQKDLMEKYNAEVRNVTSKSQRLEIRAKYRKLGLAL